MKLYEVLELKADEVMERWRRNVQGTLAPESMRTVELLDQLMPGADADLVKPLATRLGKRYAGKTRPELNKRRTGLK